MTGKRKKIKTLAEPEKPQAGLVKQIKKAAAGLWYMSETDARILPFAGDKAETVTKEVVLAQIGKPADTPVEERDFAELFGRLAAIQDWFGEEEKAAAGKFAALRDLLQKNLKDLKVFKVGRIDLDVYVVGLDGDGNLMGIKTKAVET